MFSVLLEGNRGVKYKIKSDLPVSDRTYNMIITVIGSLVSVLLMHEVNCDYCILTTPKY